MTTTAENAAAATGKTTAAGAAAAPEKRRALGRGLESLLPAGTSAPRENRGGWGTSTDGRDARPSMVENGATSAHSAPAPHGAAAPREIVLDELHAQASSRARVPAPHVSGPNVPGGETVAQIALDLIDRNPYQTRYFSQEEQESDDRVATTLGELAESIQANGVIQPIVVRPGQDGRYLLILGERRCRASKMAGMTTVPAIVRRVSDQQAAEMTVVENLQRQDLNCMEQAAAFAKLSQKFGLTQEQIGKRVGLSRESVSNYMRLLKLPGEVTQYLQQGQLGFSEARVLLTLLDPNQAARIADIAVRKHLSLDQLETLVFDTNVPLQKQGEEQTGRARWVDPNVRAAQRELETILGVKVRIRDRRGKGKIVIEYASLEDYDRVVGMLRGKRQ